MAIGEFPLRGPGFAARSRPKRPRPGVTRKTLALEGPSVGTTCVRAAAGSGGPDEVFGQAFGIATEWG